MNIYTLEIFPLYSIIITSDYHPWTSGLHPRPRRFTAMNSDVADNRCYIPTGINNDCYMYLRYLTLDTAS